MTKAEFLDQLAADERLGSKKAATDAVDAVLDTITGALSNGEEVAFTGFGKFHVAERGPRQGVNPVTGVFSVGASGRIIRDGRLAEPVREFTIAGELVGMLSAVRAAGSEARWVPFGGSVSTPPLLIAEMAISGS